MAAINGMPLRPTQHKHHWLGDGIYFWENDKRRALEWAKVKAEREELEDPIVIGAVIALENCLDLQLRENVPIIENAYNNLVQLTQQAGRSLPLNKPAPKDPRKDNVLRLLDCAVINLVHDTNTEAFDTVRGVFTEGDPIYPTGNFYAQTHIEIAVRNRDCIIGVFLPPQAQ